MILLAIDPGLRAAGLATFELPHSLSWPAGHDPLKNLREAWEFYTDPEEHLARRLFRIHRHTLETLHTIRPTVVVIETPSTGSDYGGQKARRAGTNLLYESLGTIQAAVGRYFHELEELDAVVRYVKAPTGRKTKRHKALKTASLENSIPLPTGPRGGKLPNAWDAIICGRTFIREMVDKDG
jgi:hypothetical protein